jgi:hypothetical protein
MPTVKQIFAKKDFPVFIRQHPIFKTVKVVRKIFPDIGLPNCEKVVSIDNTEEIKETALNLVENMSCALHNYIPIYKQDYTLISNLSNTLVKSVVKKDGKISLNLTKPIADKDKKIVFKQGEGVFKVYNKLHKQYQSYLPALENISAFKQFSSINIPNAKHTVRFSSDGMEGLWDIATMSMRGISSCQGWGKEYCGKLVGSIVDPFTGIIYLTSGTKTDYGSKMLRRCIVRFVVKERSKEPSIVIDTMYPEYNKAVMKEFITFLKEKTKNKFDIIDLKNGLRSNVVIPTSEVVSNLDYDCRSYRDNEIDYDDETDDETYDDRTGRELEKISDRIDNAVAKSFISCVKKLKLADVPEEYKNVIRDVKNKDVDYVNVLDDLRLWNDNPRYITKPEFKSDVEDVKKAINNHMSDVWYGFFSPSKKTENIRKKIVSEASKKVIPIINKELAKLSKKPKSPKSKYAKIYSKYL